LRFGTFIQLSPKSACVQLHLRLPFQQYECEYEFLDFLFLLLLGGLHEVCDLEAIRSHDRGSAGSVGLSTIIESLC